MNKNKKSKKKFSLNRLLNNNKFVFVLAVLISVSVWVYMSMGSSNDTTVTVTDIPIQIELSDEAEQNGLQVFSGGDQTASVTVTGNRAILGSISSSDITVTASPTTEINGNDEYTFSVTASKANQSSSFEINPSITPSYITAFVDYYRESTFDIQENVIVSIDSGYYGATALSANTVIVSGPQSVVSKIAKVSAYAELGDKKISSSTETECELILYDSDGNTIESDMIDMDVTSVKATISVLPEKTVDVVPSFLNKPSGLEITDKISIDPSEILLAAPQTLLDSTESVSLEAIDFSTLKNEKVTFDSVGIDIPSECKNISNSTSAKLTIDLSSFKSKTFTVSKFSVQGLSSDYSASVTQNSLSVTVIGPEDQINSLSDSSLTALIDMSDMQGTTGSVQMPVTISIASADQCWAYGSYKANITIEKTGE